MHAGLHVRGGVGYSLYEYGERHGEVSTDFISYLGTLGLIEV